LIAAPPVVNRIVPEPRSSIGSTTVLSAATAPRTLNPSAARTSSTVVSSTGFMYSRAGTGEYSRTSIAPRRSASEPIAEDRAVASRMSAVAKSAVPELGGSIGRSRRPAEDTALRDAQAS
jgi:hypothetical protein